MYIYTHTQIAQALYKYPTWARESSSCTIESLLGWSKCRVESKAAMMLNAILGLFTQCWNAYRQNTPLWSNPTTDFYGKVDVPSSEYQGLHFGILMSRAYTLNINGLSTLGTYGAHGDMISWTWRMLRASPPMALPWTEKLKPMTIFSSVHVAQRACAPPIAESSWTFRLGNFRTVRRFN